MMETVYGTKKYFQSLSGNGSDIYRSSACRAVTNNDYSYQNTFGRRSTIGPYQHMSKHPSYSTDLSISSQYGYNTWGVWRDQRNLAPSIYSTKSRQSQVKSFSIILSTAAFIVILAVISVAGLAFYFGTFKSSLDDPIMGFEGKFRVLKGDIYTTGLKYNHTSTYKQKVEYYKRFVERSLMDNGLNIAKVEILGFGDGPLIETRFRSFLDMRKVPQNIRSVEEHVRESILLEINSIKSLYKSIKIDPSSIDIKRILDEDLVKSASFSRESTQSNSQSYFEKRLNKKTGTVEKSNPKLQTMATPKPISKISNNDEPDVDVENAPVIQGSFEGSFEITKTDADITRKKTIPTKAVTTPTMSSISITPFPIRVVNKKTTIEKVPAAYVADSKTSKSPATTTKSPNHSVQMQTTNGMLTTDRSSLKTHSTTTPTPPPTTSRTTTTTTTTKATTTTTAIPGTSSTTMNPEAKTNPNGNDADFTTLVTSDSSEHIDPPKLDANLFTSAPILDTEPWRPIRPLGSDFQDPVNEINPALLSNLNSMFNIPAQSKVGAIESGLMPRNKIKFTESSKADNPNDMLFYHSFTNPVFMPGTSGIERLGNAPVRPHNLPLPLLDDIVIPAFKPLQMQTSTLQTEQNLFDLTKSHDKFEHIGGGVIVKKHEASEIDKKMQHDFNGEQLSTTELTLEPEFVTETVIVQLINDDGSSSNSGSSIITTTELNQLNDLPAPTPPPTQINDEKIGEFLFDLLKLPKDTDETVAVTDKDILESRIEPADTDPIIKPNFLNLKDIILNRNKLNNNTELSAASLSYDNSEISSKKPSILIPTKYYISRTRPTNTLRPQIIGKTTPSTIDDSMLFRTNTKWEYINGTGNGNGNNGDQQSQVGLTKKIFNETLQAWVVENDEKREDFTLKETLINSHNHHNNSAQIQDISLIFDTLASKLGISPSNPSKTPPFSHNKLKQKTHHDEIKTSTRTSTSLLSSKLNNTNNNNDKVFRDTPIPLNDYQIIEMLKRNSEIVQETNREDVSNLVPDIRMEGEAEIEVIDPNKYEEMLKISQSTTSSTESTPTLVTLLPVKSNSGIRRTYKSQIQTINHDDDNFRQFPAIVFKETIVKTGIHVTV